MTTLYLEHDGGRIAYDDTGNGPAVVCVPSMGDLRGEYRFLAPQLARAGYRVAGMDIRGHGETSTGWPDYSVGPLGRDVLALVRHLNAGRAVLVGTGVGAGAAVCAAAEAPALVAAMVLISPFVRRESSWDRRLLSSALFARPWGAAMWLRRFASLFPTRRPADFDAYAAALRANLEEPGRLEALQRMIAAPKIASEERVHRVTAPALVIVGGADPNFEAPEAEARWVAENLHGTVQVIQDAGHYPHVEIPEIAGAAVLSFLDRTLERV